MLLEQLPGIEVLKGASFKGRREAVFRCWFVIVGQTAGLENC